MSAYNAHDALTGQANLSDARQGETLVDRHMNACLPAATLILSG